LADVEAAVAAAQVQPGRIITVYLDGSDGGAAADR